VSSTISFRRPSLGRLAAVALALASLGAAGTALAGKRAVLRLDVAAPLPDLPDDVAWAVADGVLDAVELTAAGHPLAPVLTPDSVRVDLPGTGPLVVHSLGAGQLPRGETLVLSAGDDAPRVATFHETWASVDERYTLTADGVKHDVVVHEAAARALAGTDLRLSWLFELPDGVVLALEPRAGAVLRDETGRFLARVPEPVVADTPGGHWRGDVARLELQSLGADAVLEIVVPAEWMASPERRFPVLVDPTISLQPLDATRTGSVTELGVRLEDPIVSGSLALLGFGSDVRGFAQFDTSAIPDEATIIDVQIHCWSANHENPGLPSAPKSLALQQVLSSIDVPNPDLHLAIGPMFGGVPYISSFLDLTGPDFCPDAFIVRDYPLGAQAAADLQALLPLDRFTVGFVSDASSDPLFAHVDYIGYTEYVVGLGCEGPLPDSRMTLVVEYEADAGCTPHGHGYWHRYCLGADVIDPGRHGDGNGPGPQGRHADLPAGLLAAADAAMAPHGLTACQALDEGPLSDPLLAALRELATIHLNLAAGLLTRTCPVELHPVDDSEDLVVANAIALMEERIADGSVEALHEARWIGEHVVNREALVRQ
jgi:hypothetical protein